MARKIKFRAFGKNSKEFLRYARNRKDVFGLTLKEIKNIESIDDWDFSQWTGLKDENGKEIYEGDIIEEIHDNIWHTAVIFEDGAFYLDEPDRTLLSEVHESCEVAGNIYENPELLTSN